MRLLITGSNGFLAQKFCELLSENQQKYNVLGVSKSPNRNRYLLPSEFLQLDLSDFNSLEEVLGRFKPTHILHTAAMTSVEECEKNQDEALRINVMLTEFLAKYCKKYDLHLTFLSTDFVFNGKAGPYQESDAVDPVNYYGTTKVLAEQRVVDSGCSAAIIRTILVYGVIPDKKRSNLVLWAKNQLTTGNVIRVVHDQWRMPTWVDDLARACHAAIARDVEGIYHVSGEDMMSVEEAVRTIADTLQLNQNLISPISAEAIGQAHNRPRKTGFYLDKAKEDLDFTPTNFAESLLYICEQIKFYDR